MSSYYTTAELEAMRKAQLRKELDDSIMRLKEQLREEHTNSVQTTAGENIKQSVFVSDDSVSGYSTESIETGPVFLNEKDKSTVQREVLDLSDLLISKDTRPTKLELELESWITKAYERPIITETDERDRARIVAELAKIVASSADIEDKIKSVKMRVKSYLQGATAVTDSEKEKMEERYYEYCALCEMLDISPDEKLPYRIEKEAARMKALLERRKQDEYVMAVIEEIMGELGCHAKNSAVLDHTEGQIYSVDGHPLCDVFIGNDGSGIMFEPVGETKKCSLERKRQIENSANSICSLYSTLEERAAEQGVILNRVYAEPAHIDEMCVQEDVAESTARKKQRKATVQKQRVLNAEE